MSRFWSRPALGLPCRSLSSFFYPLASARAVFLNSRSSSSCMNLAARRLRSSRLVAGCMHKLSANGPGRRTASMWCIATSGLRLRMLIAVLPNRSMNVLRILLSLGEHRPVLWMSGGGDGSLRTGCRTSLSESRSSLSSSGGV